MTHKEISRFWSFVEREGDRDCDCWIWTRYCDPLGYGHVNVDGQMKLAHRVAYELLIGPIPEGKESHHVCENPSCVNPAHIEPLTPTEHGLTRRKNHCANGHAYTEANTYVSPAGARQCRKCVAAASRRYAKKKATRERSAA